MQDSYCRRPCFNCPFRSDIQPYQTAKDVENNIRFLFGGPGVAALCHNTIAEYSPNNNQLVCAGFLLMRKKLQLSPPDRARYPSRLRYDVPVFDSVVSFVMGGLCQEKTFSGRWKAWMSSQPIPTPEAVVARRMINPSGYTLTVERLKAILRGDCDDPSDRVREDSDSAGPEEQDGGV